MHLLKLQAECPHCGAPYADAEMNARLELGPDGRLALACPSCERLLSEPIAPPPVGSTGTAPKKEGDGSYIAAGCAAAICGICIVSGFAFESEHRGIIVGVAALAGTAAIVNLLRGLVGTGVAQAEALERASRAPARAGPRSDQALAPAAAVAKPASVPDVATESTALAELRSSRETIDYGAATKESLLELLRAELAWRDANTKKLEELRAELERNERAIAALREELDRRAGPARAGDAIAD